MSKTIEFTDVNPIANKDIFLIRNEIKKLINSTDFILVKTVKKFENNFKKVYINESSSTEFL